MRHHGVSANVVRYLSFLSPVAAMASVACKPRSEDVKQPVKWSISAPQAELRPETSISVDLGASIAKGWYIYSLSQKAGGPTPMSVTVGPTPPFNVAGDVAGPGPIVIFDKEFGIDTERYEGAPQFAVPVAVAALTSGARPSSIDVKVRFQACNATLCLPARTADLSTPVRLADR